ncbi:MAG: flagellar export protein FliJ [Curvibacter sp.]|nr:MAG: flagellar export protein FliJ [Curvibacter sp.]
MNPFHGLQLAIELAERKRDQRMLALANAQRQLINGQQQLQQLQSYANDTDNRWSGGRGMVLSAELIRHHYQFVERLQHAIGMQDGVIDGFRQQEQSFRGALAVAESRVTGLKQVLAKRKLLLAATEQRREQGRMDEMAAMVYARRLGIPKMEDTL